MKSPARDFHAARAATPLGHSCDNSTWEPMTETRKRMTIHLRARGGEVQETGTSAWVAPTRAELDGEAGA